MKLIAIFFFGCSRMADIINLARDRDFNLLTHFPGFLPDDFPGLDLAIIGITTSGSDQKESGEMDELELKNLLYFSQMLICFKFLRPVSGNFAPRVRDRMI